MITWIQFFWALIAQAAVVATLVGSGIAIAAYFNGKHIKTGVKEIGEMIKKMDEVAEKRHSEITEHFKKMDEIAEKRHSEIIGFLRLIQQQTS